MNHRHLVRLLAARRSLSLAEARRAVDALLSAMADALGRQERVDVRRFGAFATRALCARRNVHPRTGAVQALPARRAPTFRASDEWLARLNEPALRERPPAPPPRAEWSPPGPGHDSAPR